MGFMFVIYTFRKNNASSGDINFDDFALFDFEFARRHI